MIKLFSEKNLLLNILHFLLPDNIVLSYHIKICCITSLLYLVQFKLFHFFLKNFSLIFYPQTKINDMQTSCIPILSPLTIKGKNLTFPLKLFTRCSKILYVIHAYKIQKEFVIIWRIDFTILRISAIHIKTCFANLRSFISFPRKIPV